ncbi:regulatory protein RecX [Cellvibrio sp. KY-GH-1]|uniref:regulatory protein RecX n=1 Tax=Cellvibrio sp. KY-GH-1 TaxID=2303332 RepID=UPI00124659BF|nr:regulatory protein RecX [Cellvibrio sp. KY-GH-1]QEY15754.1 regulatory protein RecX [Cellvibrio sp. KY-GH-1]
MAEPIKLSDVRFAAMNLLAIREHSAKELLEKLGRKFSAPELILQVVTDLKGQNLQSDERFADAFIRMRQQQGKGCVLIKMELRERGVDGYLISQLIDESEPAWFALARDVLIKRFKQTPVDAREKAKQMRFLHSRGFSSQHIQAAFNSEYDVQ